MKIVLSVAAAAVLAALQAKPINSTCPIKGTPVKPNITAEYMGKTIAFCCGACKGQFSKNPEAIASKLPEFKNAKASAKDAKPESTTPCEVKKTVRGYFCVKCDREMGPDDIRGSECKKCESKPVEIDLCLQRVPIYTSKCQHKKRDTKPFVCCNKPWAAPTEFQENTARCTYACEVCGAKGNYEAEVKHKDDCKPKFGSGIVKVCSQSGKAPHVGKD